MESLFGRRGRSASFEEDDGESSFTFLELFSVVELELVLKKMMENLHLPS